MARESREVNGIIKLLNDWAKNYKIVLTCKADQPGVAAALGAFKCADAYIHALPRAQQRVLRLRYLEGASWEGIARLMNMRPDRVKYTAAQGICNLERLLDADPRRRTKNAHTDETD